MTSKKQEEIMLSWCRMYNKEISGLKLRGEMVCCQTPCQPLLAIHEFFWLFDLLCAQPNQKKKKEGMVPESGFKTGKRTVALTALTFHDVSRHMCTYTS